MPLWVTLEVWGSHVCYHCEACSQLHYECEVHSYLSYLCEAHSYPQIWCSLTFTLRVWGSPTVMQWGWGSLLHNWCKAHSYSYFSYHHEAHSHLHYECEHSKLCNELPLWGSLAIVLWMWTHSHLIYHCEAHSNAVGVRLTVTRYATAAKLSHIYIKRVRPTHTWVTTVRLTHSYAHSQLCYTCEAHSFTLWVWGSATLELL